MVSTKAVVGILVCLICVMTLIVMMRQTTDLAKSGKTMDNNGKTVGSGSNTEDVICESAWAFDSFGTCLLDLPDATDTTQWGWTLGPMNADLEEKYTLDLYAAISTTQSCLLVHDESQPLGQQERVGAKVGQVSISFADNNGDALISFTLHDGFQLSETAVYVGNTPNNHGNLNPETFDNRHTKLPDPQQDHHFLMDVTGEVYIMAYAKVCNQVQEASSGSGSGSSNSGAVISGGHAFTDCREAWAFGAGGKCFQDMKHLHYYYNQTSDTFLEWSGWSMGPYSSDYDAPHFDFYANAVGCDLTQATLVGTMTVQFTYGNAFVSFEVTHDYQMQDTNLYIGPTATHYIRVGNQWIPSVDKDMFPIQNKFFPTHSHTDTFHISGYDEDSVYLVANMRVCGRQKS